MNAIIENSLRDWLNSTADFADSAIHTGQSSETIPGDQPVIFVACETADPVAMGYFKFTAQIIVSTPCVIEESLTAHQALSDALKAEIYDIAPLVNFLPQTMHLAGVTLNSFGQSQSNERWVTTADIVIGIIEI